MKISEKLGHLWVQRSGPLTEELRLSQITESVLSPARLAPDKLHPSVCGYCSIGCQLNIHSKGGRAVNLSASPEYPVNQGSACPKGWEALAPLSAEDRGESPLIKQSDGTFREAGWDEALDLFCDRFKHIQSENGNESVAWIGTGQITNEELALLGALTKFGMNWIHGDGNTRQCMASAVSAYKQSFGFDAPGYTYADLEASDALVFIGANPCIAHPILWQRVMQNPKRPDIIVIDPRKTETAEAGTFHLPLLPKSDLCLLYAVARIIIQNNWVNNQFVEQSTEGFEQFSKFVEDFTLERAARETGLTESVIMNLAVRIHEKKAVSFWWTMGINQGYQGTRTAQAIINLALLTGNIGRPGTGANSITGQCNAMGSRLFSNTSSLFGGRDFQNPEHREEVADILSISESSVPSENSLAYDEILNGIENGKIKGLWIIATNPSHSWIHRHSWTKAIRSKLEFLVVQDMFHSTETAIEADLYLPAAGWGEKSGIFINSERRVGVISAVAKPPGQARSDFEILKSVANRWGCDSMFESWKTPESTFQILKRLTKGTPCDITGIKDYQMLQELGGIQWPWKENENDEQQPLQERRLYEDGKFYHDSRKARFLFEPVVTPPEAPDVAYPFWMMTGRGTSSQWHTLTRTGKSKILSQMAPENPYVEINPSDAKCLLIKHKDRVRIESRRGSMVAMAAVIATVKPGQVFIPMHYQGVNLLTHPSFDSQSHQPSYKACAVKISIEESS